MDLIADLATKSAQLHAISHISTDEEYDRQLLDHVASLRHALSTKALVCVAGDDSLFDKFDPGSDSLVYLFLLHLQIQSSQNANYNLFPEAILPSGKLWNRITAYIKAFDPVQVRYAGHEWRQLIELVAQIAQGASKPLLAVCLIRDAIMRLDPSCDVFTSLHLLLTRFCLRARAYTSVLPVLDKHICHLPLSTPCSPSKPSTIMCTSHDSGLFFITDSSGLSSKLTYKDYLQYFLYGGMIYLALKKWRKAAHFFGIVISMPTGGPVSMVMVEAYKKWILVSLLEKGKLCPPPSISSPQVIRVLQSLAKPYINLAYAFEQGDLRRLGAEIDAARDIWCTDNNMGLVSQVMNAYSKHTIIGIKKTFAALTVADLTKQAVSLWATTDAAESTIASLIMTGAIQATLVQSQADNGAAMLRFFATASLPQILQETKVQSHLQCERGSMAALMRNLDQRNHGMALSDELIDSMQKGQTWSTVGEVGVGLGTDAGLEMDEDLMGE